VDNANNRVGIGTSSPSSALDVQGDVGVSGGVYLGGTGAANYLDDYETGTWTPVVGDAASGGNTASSYTSQVGRYVKVGSLVYFYFLVGGINTSGMNAGNFLYVRGFPFTSSGGTNYPPQPVKAAYVALDGAAYLTLEITQNATAHTIFGTVDAANNNRVEISDLTSGSATILVSGTYETDA